MIIDQLHCSDDVLYLMDTKYNRVYYEDPNCFWWKCGYDPKGNRINYNDSLDCWWKCEYGSKNNEIYFEGSDGIVLDRIED